MPIVPTEAESFQIFLTHQLANGGRDKSPEDLVLQWRREQEEFQSSVAAIREALDEVERGVPGVPIEEVARKIREKHGWTTST
jgi:hypothetical protein